MPAIGLYDIYMSALILGSGYVLLSALLGHVDFSFGGDAGIGGGDAGGADLGHDVGHDWGHDVGHDAGQPAHDTGHIVDATDEQERAFSAFSPTIIASFLAGFGMIGLVLQQGYGWTTVSLAPASIGGLVFARFLMAVFNKLARAASGSSHSRVKELIGISAEVVSPIGEDSTGLITYVLRGARFSRSARSANGKPIARGDKVTIEAIDSNVTYVIKAD